MKIPLSRINICIAPGFDEEFVVPCVLRFRKAGIPIGLMGVRTGEVVGANELGICPDYLLDDWKSSQGSQMLILPGGVKSVQRWMIEPRLVRIGQSILEQRGVLVFAKEAQQILSSGFLKLPSSPTSKIISQGEMTNKDFIQQIYLLGLQEILPSHSLKTEMFSRKERLQAGAS